MYWDFEGDASEAAQTRIACCPKRTEPPYGFPSAPTLISPFYIHN